MQTIMPHNWTKLLGYELDVHHQHTANINVWVEDDQLKSDANAEVILRPTGGTYPETFRAPLAGHYAYNVRSSGQQQTATAFMPVGGFISPAILKMAAGVGLFGDNGER